MNPAEPRVSAQAHACADRVCSRTGSIEPGRPDLIRFRRTYGDLSCVPTALVRVVGRPWCGL